MDTSSVEQTSRPARLLGIVGRPALLVTVLTAVMLGIAVSCGGGDGDSGGEDEEEERTYTIQTFTPTVPGTTPDTLVTQEARQTAAANTATAIAENPPEPTATVTPGGPNPEDAFRPPLTQLSDGTNQMEGVAGSFALADEESQTYPVIQAPFYDVGENGLTVAPASQLEFNILEEVAPPSEVQIAVYGWDENNAIPQTPDGAVGTHPVFAQRVAPVSTETFPVADPSFAMPDEPGRYVVLVTVNWPPDERVSPELPTPFATYAFTVYVA